MKRVLFLSSAIFILLSAFAQQVTRQEAVNAAVNTMKYNGRTSLAKSSVLSVQSKNKGDTVLIYEVLFQSGEMVLLSGNKACLPVLGYSLPTAVSAPLSILDNYADIPDGLRDMLSEYEEQILYCFRNNLTSSHYEKWQDLQDFESGRAITTDIVSPLLTTRWGQNESNDYLNMAVCNAYNYYVTETDNSCTCGVPQKCPTGCVATAMAQIMKYWNYPVWMPDKAEQFDWCNMPNELFYSNNPNYTVERNAIARLMRDCGSAVNMRYCNNGCKSVASDTAVPGALKSFGYSNDVTFKKKGLNTYWLSMLKNNLDNGYPVYYRGQDDNGLDAHAFVCDGYRSDNNFHFNWGWNGNFNVTWWTIDQLYPNYHSYNSKQAAVFNIHPKTTQNYCNFETPLWTHYYYYYTIFGNSTPLPYANVPKTFTRLTSVPNDPQYPATWRTIPTGATSEYVAHKEILLQDGFLAEAGSDFYAHIVPCGSCEEGRTTGEMSDVIGGGDDNPADTLPAPKSLQTEVSPADETTLTVYPNPTDDLLFVELRGAGIANVALYDLQGRVVTDVCDTPLQTATATLNVKSLPAGVYVLRVKDADGREYQGKIVKR